MLDDSCGDRHRQMMIKSGQFGVQIPERKDKPKFHFKSTYVFKIKPHFLLNKQIWDEGEAEQLHSSQCEGGDSEAFSHCSVYKFYFSRWTTFANEVKENYVCVKLFCWIYI